MIHAGHHISGGPPTLLASLGLNPYEGNGIITEFKSILLRVGVSDTFYGSTTSFTYPESTYYALLTITNGTVDSPTLYEPYEQVIGTALLLNAVTSGSIDIAVRAEHGLQNPFIEGGDENEFAPGQFANVTPEFMDYKFVHANHLGDTASQFLATLPQTEAQIAYNIGIDTIEAIGADTNLGYIGLNL